MGSTDSTCCGSAKPCSAKPLHTEISSSRQKQSMQQCRSARSVRAHINTDDSMKPGETSDDFGGFSAASDTSPIRRSQKSKKMVYDGFRPKWMLNDAPPRFYQRLAKFFVALPEKSRVAIWDSSVPTGEVNGIPVQTNNKEHISNIICRLVIIYCKYQDRKKPKLSMKAVKPYTDEISAYIYDKHHPLEKEKFVHISDDAISHKENDYFYRILIGFANHSKAKQGRNRAN